MKKSVIFGILALAACAATSYGQGYVSLDNYFSNNGANGPGFVVYGAGVFANGISGPLGTVGAGLNSSWTVGLYYVGGTVAINEPAGNGIPNAALALGTGTGSTAQVDSAATGSTPGTFSALNFFSTGSTANTTGTFEIVAYDSAASSYATAAFRGHSASFSMSTVAQTSPVAAYVGDNFTTFSVTAVPEPTTLALAGLGGLASLVALRRKKA